MHLYTETSLKLRSLADGKAITSIPLQVTPVTVLSSLEKNETSIHLRMKINRSHRMNSMNSSAFWVQQRKIQLL